MTNPYPVHHVLQRLVSAHLMREVVAHVADHVKLRPFLCVHHFAEGVQVVEEVVILDEPMALRIAVLLHYQGDVVFDVAARLGQRAAEQRLVDRDDIVMVELAKQLTNVDAAPRAVPLNSPQQWFHVGLTIDVQWSQRSTGPQNLLLFNL